ncbi:MAG: trypsin-like peptidase domain-containing protein [Candidatus Omnitrophica bacterium]|nr:trypsin-like peptidase domain-containing protein [Candidatus Omnitrophota bacterium]
MLRNSLIASLVLSLIVPLFSCQASEISAVEFLSVNLPSIVAVSSKVPVIKGVPATPGKRVNPLLFLAKHRRVMEVDRKGAGIIIAPSGLIATNAHIVRKATDITVTLSTGETLPAKLVTASSSHDLAIVKIDPPRDLRAVEFGDSEKIRLGDKAYTVGSSLILKDTMYQGKIIGIGNFDNKSLGAATRVDLIKTNLELLKGDSGAPLFDAAGKCLGLLYASATGRARYTFAVPSSVILQDSEGADK